MHRLYHSEYVPIGVLIVRGDVPTTTGDSAGGEVIHGRLPLRIVDRIGYKPKLR